MSVAVIDLLVLGVKMEGGGKKREVDVAIWSPLLSRWSNNFFGARLRV